MFNHDIYLNFINQFNLPILSTIINLEIDNSEVMIGWINISSMICKTEEGKIYDIDVRYAWGKEIFQQDTFDFGWTETTLLNRTGLSQTNRHKLIIYLCEPSVGLDLSEKIDVVPNKFIIGQYWKTITHLYLRLPFNHPFPIPNITEEMQKLTFSTVTNLSQQKPDTVTPNILSNRPQNCEGGLRTKGLFKQSLPNQPLVSVITVVFNGENYLEQTIQSVINQSYQNLEYIIIDGGSRDGSIDIIKKYDDFINYWLSEPDSGIYDAMNKGTLIASGNYTLHINSDDLLFSSNSLNIDMQGMNFIGSALLFHVKDGVINKIMPKQLYDNLYMNFVKNSYNHQAFIGKKSPLSMFDLNYKIVSDRIVMYEKAKYENIIFSQKAIAICRTQTGGISSENNFQMIKELKKITANKGNLRVYYTLFMLELYSYLRMIFQFLRIVKLKRKYFG